MGYTPVPATAYKLRVRLGHVFNATTSGGTVGGSGFLASDVGAIITIIGAGTDGGPLWSTVTGYSGPTSISISPGASTAVIGARAILFRTVDSTVTPESYVLIDTAQMNAGMSTKTKTFDFTLYSGDGAVIPVSGQPVLVTHDDYGDIFGGRIEQTSIVNYNPQGTQVETECQCVSWEAILNARLLRMTTTVNPTITETFHGGYGYQIFVLGRVPIAPPSITLNGSAQTVGYRGVDTGKDWYYTVTDNLLYQDAGGTPIAGGDSLVVITQYPAQDILNFYNKTVGQIVTTLMARIADEGMSVNTVTGPTLAKLNFSNSDTIGSALDALVALISNGTTNYWYRVTPRKVLYFEEYGATAAPWSIRQSTGSDGNILFQIRYTTTREKFGNAVFEELSAVQGTDLLTDYFDGTGSQTTFNTTYPMNVAPTVKVSRAGGAFAEETLGIKEDPVTGHGKQWYWSPGNNSIEQDATGIVLAAQAGATPADQLSVAYFPVRSLSYNYTYAASVSARAAIEGGSGETDLYRSSSTPVVLDFTDNPAEPIAKISASLSGKLEVKTYRGGIDVNMVMTVELPQVGANGTFLVENVTLSIVNKMPVWTLTLTTGALIGDWLTALKNLGKTPAFLGLGSGGGTPAGTEAPPQFGDPPFSPAIYEDGVFTVEHINIANASGISGIDWYLISIDERLVDPKTGAWYTGGATDATSDPITGVVTKNPDCTVTFDAQIGDWVLWNDPGKYEWGQITNISGGSWTIQRHYAGTPAGEATFNSLKAAHSAGVKLFVCPLAGRRFVQGAQHAGFSDATVPDRFDMALAGHVVGAVVAAPFNASGYGSWVVYNCATATLPGLRTLVGANHTFQRAGALVATPGEPVGIPKDIQYVQPLRVLYARVLEAPTGSDAIFNVVRQRAAGGSPLWEVLETLTIPAGSLTSYATPPALQQKPYSGDFPFPILEPGDRISYTIEQRGSTVAGSNLLLEVFT